MFQCFNLFFWGGCFLLAPSAGKSLTSAQHNERAFKLYWCEWLLKTANWRCYFVANKDSSKLHPCRMRNNDSLTGRFTSTSSCLTNLFNIGYVGLRDHARTNLRCERFNTSCYTLFFDPDSTECNRQVSLSTTICVLPFWITPPAR